MYYVYILQCADKTFYTGITTDLERRVTEHNVGKLGAKYTARRRPVKLVYSKKYENRSLASQEEARIKKLKKEEKNNLIKNINKKISSKSSVAKNQKLGIIESMKLTVEINNLSKSPIKKSFFVKVMKDTLKKAGCDFLAEKEISVSVALISPEEIQKLNRTYRKKNAVTDVLSFCEYKTQKKLREAGDKEVFLGEIVLCYNDIKDYALNYKKDFPQELTKVASHGLLHLLGFKHSLKMFSLQKEIAEEVAFKLK